MAHGTSYPVHKYISLGNWVQKQAANCVIFLNGHAYHAWIIMSWLGYLFNAWVEISVIWTHNNIIWIEEIPKLVYTFWTSKPVNISISLFRKQFRFCLLYTTIHGIHLERKSISCSRNQITDSRIVPLGALFRYPFFSECSPGGLLAGFWNTHTQSFYRSITNSI